MQAKQQRPSCCHYWLVRLLGFMALCHFDILGNIPSRTYQRIGDAVRDNVFSHRETFVLLPRNLAPN